MNKVGFGPKDLEGRLPVFNQGSIRSSELFLQHLGELSLLRSQGHPGGGGLPSGRSNKLPLGLFWASVSRPSATTPPHDCRSPALRAPPAALSLGKVDGEEPPTGSQGDPLSGCFAAGWHKSQITQRLAPEVVLYMKCNSRESKSSAKAIVPLTVQCLRARSYPRKDRWLPRMGG